MVVDTARLRRVGDPGWRRGRLLARYQLHPLGDRHSLDDRVVFARLGVAAALICLAVRDSSLVPLAFTATLSLLLFALTAFETLYAHTCPRTECKGA
jgi:hypothetical protein